ncbi:MAG: ABC transporter ATP-binding protein [bacterium]|nr:ABC transporter ATP-binding protein [bacterium]
MSQVILKNVTKSFGNVTAVSDVNLEINDKEFLVLVGPSGCGKTTCLRMIAGLEEITGGEIVIGDTLVNHIPPKDRDIAMVFQNYALYPHMSVYDNMAFGLKLRKYNKADIKQKVYNAAEILGIQHLLNRKPKELSGGQRQRVALGRAIVREPKVFLMDEPLSNLDAKLRVQTRAELIKLHRTLGITTIYVTHDQTEAMSMGDRIVIMRDGIVQQVATPLELYNSPNNVFVGGFIGSPAMNFLNGKVVSRNGDIVFEGNGFTVGIPDNFADLARGYLAQEAILGIRPEDIYDESVLQSPLNNYPIKANVEVKEPMGSHVFLYLSIGGVNLTASVDAETRAEMGTVASVYFDAAKIHLFDKETERVVF